MNLPVKIMLGAWWPAWAAAFGTCLGVRSGWRKLRGAIATAWFAVSAAFLAYAAVAALAGLWLGWEWGLVASAPAVLLAAFIASRELLPSREGWKAADRAVLEGRTPVETVTQRRKARRRS